MFPVLGGFIDQITDEMLTGPVERYGSWSLAAFGLPAETALSAYAAAHPGGSPGDVLADVLTDWWVRVPAVRLADAHAPAPAGTFMYEFTWASPAFGGRLGACHALEIPFVFDTLDLGRGQMLGGALGDDPPQGLADDMHAAWVRFADGRGSGLAAVRPRAPMRDALRGRAVGRRRPLRPRARAVGGRALTVSGGDLEAAAVRGGRVAPHGGHGPPRRRRGAPWRQ